MTFFDFVKKHWNISFYSGVLLVFQESYERLHVPYSCFFFFSLSHFGLIFFYFSPVEEKKQAMQHKIDLTMKRIDTYCQMGIQQIPKVCLHLSLLLLPLSSIAILLINEDDFFSLFQHMVAQINIKLQIFVTSK